MKRSATCYDCPAASRWWALAAVAVLVTGCSLVLVGHSSAPDRFTGRSGSINRVSFITLNGRRLQQARANRFAAPTTPGNATQSQTGSQPLCKWDDEQAQCSPTFEAWKTPGAGMPSSHYRRAALLASERDRHCSQHATAQACAQDWEMRCFRQGLANATNARCASSDMEEMLMFSAKGFTPDLSLIPHSMTCPDTPARSFFDCYAFAGRLDICNARPHCTVLDSLGSMRHICVPKSWLQKKLSELKPIFNGLISYSTDTYGSCGASCWLQEARNCSKLTTKQGCDALPYCEYDEAAAARAKGSILLPPSSDAMESGDEEEEEGKVGIYGSRLLSARAVVPGGCRHRSREFSSSNTADQAAQKVYRECSNAKTRAACMAVKQSASSKGAASRMAMVDWKRYEPTGVAPKCSTGSGSSSAQGIGGG